MMRGNQFGRNSRALGLSRLSSAVGGAEPPALAGLVAIAEATAQPPKARAGGAASTAIPSNILFDVYGV